jgi:hypothetical protein
MVVVSEVVLKMFPEGVPRGLLGRKFTVAIGSMQPVMWQRKLQHCTGGLSARSAYAFIELRIDSQLLVRPLHLSYSRLYHLLRLRRRQPPAA